MWSHNRKDKCLQSLDFFFKIYLLSWNTMSYLGIIFLLDYKALFHVFRLFLGMPLNIDQHFESVCFDGDDDIVQSNHMSNLSLICHNGRWGENNKSEHKIVHHTDEIYFTTNKWNTEPQLKGNIKSKYNAFLGSV